MRLSSAFDVAAVYLTSCLLLLLLVTRATAKDLPASASVAPRYLVYPPPTSGSPTKVQLIFGLGIPMEVDVSTIVGYVMKCNYNLPYNASYLAEPYLRHSTRRRSTATATTDKDLIDTKTPSTLQHSKSRAKKQEKMEDEEEEEEAELEVVGRYEIYKMFESAIDSGFQSGKACLLRAICEVAATPLNVNDGLLPQLLHTFLTPSTTIEQYKESIDQEYLAAEYIGRRDSIGGCLRSFAECENNFLEYISRIH